MAEKEDIKKKDEKKLKKDLCEEAQLPTKCKAHRPAFMEILKGFRTSWDGHLGPISVFKHRIDLLNDEAMPVLSSQSRVRSTAR